jgi:hypothetical protein
MLGGRKQRGENRRRLLAGPTPRIKKQEKLITTVVN